MFLKWAVVFFLVALIAAVFGFGEVAEAAVDIGQVLFFVFLVLFALALVVGLVQWGRTKHSHPPAS